MFSNLQWLSSVADVAILGFAAAVALIVLTRSTVLPLRRLALVPLIRGQSGAAYSLSLVLVLPLYIVILATIIECALMMLVKMGTMHAAFAAARAATVWLPAEVEPDQRREMIELAAAQALAPFASGKPLHLAPTGRAAFVGDEADRAYFEAYQGYSHGWATLDYLATKRQYARAATTVATKIIPPWHYSASLRRGGGNRFVREAYRLADHWSIPRS